MRFVIDASMAVKSLVDEPDSDAGRALAASSDEPQAPRPMASEIAMRFGARRGTGQIERTDAGAAALSDQVLTSTDNR